MTKKHFKQLAEGLNQLRQHMPEDNKLDFDQVQAFISGFCMTQNPNFDSERFYNACHGLPYKK